MDFCFFFTVMFFFFLLSILKDLSLLLWRLISHLCCPALLPRQLDGPKKKRHFQKKESNLCDVREVCVGFAYKELSCVCVCV